MTFLGLLAKIRIFGVLFLCFCIFGFLNCRAKPSSDTGPITDARCTNTELSDLETAIQNTLAAVITDVDFSLLVNSADHRQIVYERGTSTVSTSYESASTSKFVTAAVILSFVDRGYLTLNSKPTDYPDIKSYWTTDDSNPISRITLRDLLSFTSGLNKEPLCLVLADGGRVDIAGCVQNIYNKNVDNNIEPDTQFYYGSSHLQVAGLMAMMATGFSTWAEVFNNFKSYYHDHEVDLFPSSTYDLPNTTNPRLAGGMHWIATEYVDFLKAFYEGKLLSPALMTEVLQDHIVDAAIVYSPALIT